MAKVPLIILQTFPTVWNQTKMVQGTPLIRCIIYLNWQCSLDSVLSGFRRQLVQLGLPKIMPSYSAKPRKLCEYCEQELKVLNLRLRQIFASDFILVWFSELLCNLLYSAGIFRDSVKYNWANMGKFDSKLSRMHAHSVNCTNSYKNAKEYIFRFNFPYL